MNPNKGITSVLLQGARAEALFEKIRPKLFVEQADKNVLTGKTREMHHSVKAHVKRAEFFADMNRLEPEECFEKYFPETIRVRLERMLRRKLVRFSVYRSIKRVGRSLKKESRVWLPNTKSNV